MYKQIEESKLVERLKLDETKNNFSIIRDLNDYDLQTENLMNLMQKNEHYNHKDYAMMIQSIQGSDRVINEAKIFDPFLTKKQPPIKATSLVNQPPITSQSATGFSPNNSNIHVLGQSQLIASNPNSQNEIGTKQVPPLGFTKNIENFTRSQEIQAKDNHDQNFQSQLPKQTYCNTERSGLRQSNRGGTGRQTEGFVGKDERMIRQANKARSISPRLRLPFIYNDEFKAEYADNLNESSIMDLDGMFKNKARLSKRGLQREITTCHDFGAVGKLGLFNSQKSAIPDERPERKKSVAEQLQEDLAYTTAIKEKVKQIEERTSPQDARNSN